MAKQTNLRSENVFTEVRRQFSTGDRVKITGLQPELLIANLALGTKAPKWTAADPFPLTRW